MKWLRQYIAPVGIAAAVVTVGGAFYVVRQSAEPTPDAEARIQTHTVHSATPQARVSRGGEKLGGRRMAISPSPSIGNNHRPVDEPSTRMPETPEAARRVLDARVAEVRDVQAESALSGELQKEFEVRSIAGSEIKDVTCSNAICRVVFSHSDPVTKGDVWETVRPRGATGGDFFLEPDEEGEMRSTAYYLFDHGTDKIGTRE